MPQSRNLGAWSNKIGYEMGSLLVGVYIMAKTSLVENFKHEGGEMTWLST